MGRFGNISKSVPTQGWQNHEACEVAGIGQDLKCSPSRSLNFNDNFSQGMALKFVNFPPPGESKRKIRSGEDLSILILYSGHWNDWD